MSKDDFLACWLLTQQVKILCLNIAAVLPRYVPEGVVHGLPVELARLLVDYDGGVHHVVGPVGAPLGEGELLLLILTLKAMMELLHRTSMSRAMFQSVQPTTQWLRSSMMLFMYLRIG